MSAQAVPLRIGDVAARVGTTTRTIRYYEEIGLLPGGPDRRAGAHRLYGEEDVERLRELLRLKELLGLSLDELRELVAAEDARSARRAEWEAGSTRSGAPCCWARRSRTWSASSPWSSAAVPSSTSSRVSWWSGARACSGCSRADSTSFQDRLRTVRPMHRSLTTAAASAAAIAAAAGVAYAAGGSSSPSASPSPAPASSSRIDDGAQLLPQAGITEQQAIDAALAAASGKLNEIDLEQYQGTLVFNVDVGQADVKVDAATGDVSARRRQRRRRGRGRRLMRRAAAMLAGATAVLACAAPAHAFTPRVTNPYYPLLPGMRWEYRGREGRPAPARRRRVTDRVERIDGVPCAVVSDRVFRRRPARASAPRTGTRRTAAARVWYFGEATAELDRHGQRHEPRGLVARRPRRRAAGDLHAARTRGSGSRFAQEHYPGHAEDHFEIVSRTRRSPSPFGTSAAAR